MLLNGSCRTTGTNTMTSSNKTNYSMLYNIVTKQVSQRTVLPELLMNSIICMSSAIL